MHIETKHQSNLAALPMVISGSLSAYEAMSKTNNFGCLAPNGEEFIPCVRCGYRGCDVRVSGCGCTFHAVSYFARFQSVLITMSPPQHFSMVAIPKDETVS